MRRLALQLLGIGAVISNAWHAQRVDAAQLPWKFSTPRLDTRVRSYTIAMLAGFVLVVGAWAFVLRVDRAAASTDQPPVIAAPASAPTPQPTDILDAPGMGVDLLLKLGAVLGLAYVSLALLKRYTFGANSGSRNGLLKVVESTALGPNRSVYLLRAGQRHILVGVTATTISPLSEWLIDDPASPAEVPASVREHIASLGA